MRILPGAPVLCRPPDATAEEREMINAVLSLGGWSWVILGLLLIGGEMLTPGIFLIWLGVAALATGVLVGLAGIGWQTAALVFAGLCIVSVLAGRKLTRRRDQEPDAASGLNDRGRQLIGKTFRLEATMTGGEGRVIRVDGATLLVEKA
jgi:membrane protein implicated in regulation of membrane protease activity